MRRLTQFLLLRTPPNRWPLERKEMIGLLSLPDELILAIFELLPDRYFQKNTKILTVSRHWHRLARESMYHTIFLNTSRTVALLELTNLGQQLLEHVRWMNWAVLRVSLDVNLPEEYRNYIALLSRWPSVTFAGHCAIMRDINKGALSLFKRVQRLQIITQPSFHEGLSRPDHRRTHSVHDVGMANLRVLLSLPYEHLTHLDISTNVLFPMNQGVKPQFHACLAIRHILPRLLKLRCRMQHICPGIFKNPEGIVAQSPRLTHVLIELATKCEEPRCVYYDHSVLCHGSGAVDMRRKVTDQMITCVTELVPRMRRPHLARVYSVRRQNNRPYFRPYYYDAITQTETMLPLESSIPHWTGPRMIT